jgi:hypothetical protein
MYQNNFEIHNYKIKMCCVRKQTLYELFKMQKELIKDQFYPMSSRFIEIGQQTDGGRKISSKKKSLFFVIRI